MWGTLHEGKSHDARGMRFAANVDLEFGSRMSPWRIDGCEGNPRAEGRRVRAARHHADGGAACEDRLAVAGDCTIHNAESDEAPEVPPGALREERGPAEELPIPGHEPAAAELEGCLTAIEVLAGE
jgi:hypothetical protein